MPRVTCISIYLPHFLLIPAHRNSCYCLHFQVSRCICNATDFRLYENYGNSSSLCVNTAAQELVLSRRFKIQNSHSELKELISHQTLKGYISVKPPSYGDKGLGRFIWLLLLSQNWDYKQRTPYLEFFFHGLWGLNTGPHDFRLVLSWGVTLRLLPPFLKSNFILLLLSEAFPAPRRRLNAMPSCLWLYAAFLISS